MYAHELDTYEMHLKPKNSVDNSTSYGTMGKVSEICTDVASCIGKRMHMPQRCYFADAADICTIPIIQQKHASRHQQTTGYKKAQ